MQSRIKNLDELTFIGMHLLTSLKSWSLDFPEASVKNVNIWSPLTKKL